MTGACVSWWTREARRGEGEGWRVCVCVREGSVHGCARGRTLCFFLCVTGADSFISTADQHGCLSPFPFPFPFPSSLGPLRLPVSALSVRVSKEKKKTRGAILLSFSTFLAPNNPLIIIVFFSVFLTNGSAPPLISTSLIPTTNRISAKKCKSKSIDEAGVH